MQHAGTHPPAYANQARLELSTLGQPFCRHDASADEVRPMSEKFLWYIGTMNPLHLWIIQFSIIIGTATLLSFVLRKIRQPKVIAEVLSGILLGPTVCGRISGFTENVFPPESRPYLALTADIGLRLFFFLFGLQIEPSVVKKNLRVSAIIALAGMIFPFVTGAGMSVLLYEQFVNENIRITYFMFFSGVAFSVTAFPVMCRILTQSKLLNTTVGAAVISAGVGNDVIGWILLALGVAMLKAGSSLEAIYMILSCGIWTLILLFPVKSFLRMLAKSTGSVDNGPSILFMTITVSIVFSSALVTNINGVHGIFGAFLTGLIIPRDGNLATSMLEKLEDMVEIIFLPFYFALLGMSTNLGFLNDGITWVYTVSIIFAAFVSKFGSCAIAAKYTAGFSWRESGAIGSFMSCKGLVELIVLDVGLSAGIFTPRVFTMFVLEALVLTLMTTPLAVRLYPPKIHKRIVFGSTTFRDVTSDDSRDSDTLRGVTVVSKRRITVVLDRVEHLPGVMAFTQLFGSRSSSTPYRSMQKRAALSIEALRLIELSERACAVMKSSDTLLKTDHLLVILKMFGRLHTIPIAATIDITTYDSYADSVIDYAYSRGSDLIALPWLLLPANISHRQTVPNESFLPLAHDGAGRAAANVTAKPSAQILPRFLQSIFENARADVALFLDRNIENPAQGKIHHHLFLPFFGGHDDRLALDFVAQLCENDAISATVMRFIRESQNEIISMTQTTKLNHGTVLGNTESDTADALAWKYHTSRSASPSMSSDSSFSHIAMKTCVTTLPLHAAIREAQIIKQPGTRLLIVVGRRKHLQANISRELFDLIAEYGDLDEEVKKTIGDIATVFVAANRGNGVLVLQKAGCHLD